MNKTLESLAFSAVAIRSLRRDGGVEVVSRSLQAGAGRQNGAKRHLYDLALGSIIIRVKIHLVPEAILEFRGSRGHPALVLS